MKVASANICLDCDTLFDSEHCPKCLNKSFYPLRKWLAPLHSFSEIKEVRKHVKSSINPLQEKSQGVFPNFIYPAICPNVLANTVPSANEEAVACEQSATARDNQAEPSESEARASDNHGGEQVGCKSGFKSWRHWFDAGYAFIREIVWFYKRRLVLPSEEHTSRVLVAERLSK